MKLRFLVPLAAILALGLATPALGVYPSSIASTGDSITRAYNTCWFPYQLFSLYRYDLGANSVWATAGICQSMLANPWSNLQADVDRRARVRQRNIDYNTQLGQACAMVTLCRFDANAVFNTAFVRSDVTTRDYFHPSVAGQAKLAAVTWSQAAGFLQ